ncbi:class I SAM-dependent methyltransferase [Actinomadura rupiterrae]|uniref:class I SAM-dependent methyltransferase n=1 Tax=Actinomadura rupiterrae TaxID=559627 RepID=UPI0020A573B7|nr:class I SAM-dependent methyltransferase [Actinomadura rupiterrae]MCP2337226.1 SAM-dependent methyltransferase [Actinomadura rupiterrae]
MTAQIVNTAQSEAWNGGEGAHWAAHHDRYDLVNSGFNEYLLQFVHRGDRVLDVGCGNGQLTRLAARTAQGGRATGVDLSGPMLGRARERAQSEGVANVRFEQGDAQVFPFTPASYDVALSRFGIMFFADPVAAFANIGRALRTGGRLAFVAMDPVAGGDIGILLGAIAGALGMPDPATGADGTGPTSLADPAHTERILTEAGFSDIRIRRVEAPRIWGRNAADATEFFCGWGPMVHAFAQADPDAVGAAREAVYDQMARFQGPEDVRTDGSAWLVSARYDWR